MKRSIAMLFFVCLILFQTNGQQLSETRVDFDVFRKSKPATKKMYVIKVNTTAQMVKDDLNTVNTFNVRSHVLGEEVAKRMHLLDQYYVYRSKPAPGAFSGREFIEKPGIYYSIYKLDKDYKKKSRRSSPEESAFYAEEFMVYIDYALLMKYSDSKEFEKELKKANSVEEIKELFNQVVFK